MKGSNMIAALDVAFLKKLLALHVGIVGMLHPIAEEANLEPHMIHARNAVTTKN